MSRYIGPVSKKLRALNLPLKKFRKKGNNLPGQHGNKKKMRKSVYGLQLKEKSKLIYSYGWRDKQLKNKFIKAKAKSGNIGINLLKTSVMRLDNVIFCSKLFHTLSFARQWVAHGFFLVDGQKVNIPSYQVKPGQVIGIIERKKDKIFKNKLIKDNLEKDQKIPSYLELDKQKMLVTCHRYPTDKELIELNKDIDINLVVEWYSKKA